MHDIITEDDIAELVDAFYSKVVVDPVIGFIFTDVVELSWEEHIPIMNAFWGSILLGTGTYRRNPMQKHIELDKRVLLVPEHFNRWLELWELTLLEHFSGPTAEHALARAKNIAAVMQHQLRQSRTPDAADVFRLTE
jgi:hemoglobin